MPLHIKDHPSELIDVVARHLDNFALVKFKSASPTLCTRSHYEFGKRFFHELPIGMNAIGL